MMRRNRPVIRGLLLLGAVSVLFAVRRWIGFASDHSSLPAAVAGILVFVAAAVFYAILTLRRFAATGVTGPAWRRRQARAQRRTATTLQQLTARGFAVLHDRRIGPFGAHLDHVVVAADRAWLVQDARSDDDLRQAANACLSDAQTLGEKAALAGSIGAVVVTAHRRRPPPDPAVTVPRRRLLDAFPPSAKWSPVSAQRTEQIKRACPHDR